MPWIGDCAIGFYAMDGSRDVVTSRSNFTDVGVAQYFFCQKHGIAIPVRDAQSKPLWRYLRQVFPCFLTDKVVLNAILTISASQRAFLGPNSSC